MPRLMPPRQRRSQPHRRETGLSLIEALIALVVLSIGLLGLASLQINSLKFNQTAHLRTQASQLAYRMLDTLRASPASAEAGEFDIALADTPTGSEIGKVEIRAWKTDITNQLPEGRGAVCRTNDAGVIDPCSGAGDFTVVTVEWNEANDPKATRATQQFQLVSQVAATPIP